jgi:V8-like Glu-specific endopeptidase
MSRILAAASLLLLASLAGCAATDPVPAAGRAEAVVYGRDDRTDVYAHGDAALRELARGSIVALMRPDALDTSDPSNVTLRAYTLGEAYMLCGGERFAGDPTAASCSGTLVDDDLVITAGHCIDSQADCEGWRFVFDYHYAADGVLETIERTDVYGCRRLVARELTMDGSRDYAVVQLDRPATDDGRVPADVKLDDSPVTEGMPLVIIGFGSGIPAKIDAGGQVIEARERLLDYFEASTDSFGGNSGSGVFDFDRRMIGILVRGDADYVANGSCNVVNVLPMSGGPGGGEDVTYVRRALDALCAEGWPSARLCGGSGASCGDGTCTGDETSDSCASDCAAGSCGDGVCDVSEDATSCAADCDGPDRATPPPEWTCPIGYWGTRDGCDCGSCGAVRDPDCDVAGQRVFGCGTDETCGASGQCVPGGGGGGVWTCPAAYFGTRDGCDCECGAHDPDCDDSTQMVLNCAAGLYCNAAGHCDVTGGGMPATDDGFTCGVAPARRGGLALFGLVAGLGVLAAVRRGRAARAGARSSSGRRARG